MHDTPDNTPALERPHQIIEPILIVLLIYENRYRCNLSAEGSHRIDLDIVTYRLDKAQRSLSK
jgi:hypothetical protein